MSKKILYTLEYPVRCSPTILYDFLSNPSGLQEWFADTVNVQDGVYSFGWSGAEETADLVDSEQDKFIKYHWTESEDDEYFEFYIDKSEVTNQTILVVKDFAEKADIKDQSQLWDKQLKDLFHRIGG